MFDRAELLMNFFSTKGYQPILVARSNLRPPDIYLLDEDQYQRFGPLSDVLSEEIQFKLSSGVAPALETVEVKGRTGSFKFMQNLLERFGWLGTAKAAGNLNLSGDEIFRLRNVTLMTVAPVEIEAALNKSLDSKKLGLERIKAASVHVVYEYLYSGGLDVTLGNQSNASIDLKADVFKSAEAEAAASARRDSVDTTAHHNKGEPVAVAFKAAQLTRTGSAWRLNLKSRQGAGIAPPTDPYIFKPNVVLDFEGRT
jgi:hypothetical protein